MGTKKISPQEALEKAKEIYGYDEKTGKYIYDADVSHELVDKFIEELLIQQGYGEMVELLRTMTRWYS
jgi:hypothetical protein